MSAAVSLPSARKSPRPSTIARMLVLESGNEKIGLIAATYAPIAITCPASCPLRDRGCYAQGGNVRYTNDRITREYDGLDGDTLALIEAAAIVDGAGLVPAGRPLRLHVSGDASTAYRASVLADAAAHWPGPVYTYTHAWRDVPRAAWGGVSVLASVETLADARRALDAGYAPAIVVASHPADGRAYVDAASGVRVIPCPNQTRGLECTSCRLCFDAVGLAERGSAIAFAAHGGGRKRALTVVQ